MLHQEWRCLNPQIAGPRSIYNSFIASVPPPTPAPAPAPPPPDSSSKRVSAKASLHQLCTAKHWKYPLFECCNEEGPPHHKLFTFKVTVESEEGRSVIESLGNSQTSKKAAAEDAAEGALWCLKHMGIE